MTTINFNFYINGNKPAGFGDILAAALSGACTHGDFPTATEGAAAEQAAPVTAAPVAAEKTLAERIVDVLNDKSKYRKRSAKGVAKAVGATEGEVELALDDLIDDGKVEQSGYSGLYFV